MARDTSELTDEQWEKSRPCSLSPKPLHGVVPNLSQSGPVSKGFYGFYAREHAGKICPSGIPPPVPAGDACGIGKTKTSG
jgi:hypothetical protein